MSITSPTASAKKAIHKIDIAQVSLNLQDRLGLAKIRYERINGLNKDIVFQGDGEHTSNNGSGVGETVSDSSSEISDGRHTAPFTSSPQTPIISSELPRSTRSKHAATFDINAMECMTSGSRKRRRHDMMAEQHYSKAPRISWGAPEPVPQSSPSTGRQRRTHLENPPSFVSESDTIPDDSHSSHHDQNPRNIDPELSKNDIPSSSMISSSPPRTPPPKRNNRLTSHRNGQDGADLLLYLANSPTPANLGGKGHIPDFLPSTPPTQYAVLPSLLSTPSQPFNFADFVNVTPSPAQRPWGNLTPLPLPKTPRTTKDVRKRLNFDAMAPPSAPNPSAKSPEKKAGLALQLGEELRL